jgi:excisionase family DNA binding protein
MSSVRFLTTNQIAALVGVSERTVANWIDRGHIDAHRTPGRHRRVSPDELVSFLNQRGMPVPKELQTNIRVLIVEDDVMVARTLQRQLNPEESGYEVTCMEDGLSALIHIGHNKPHVVLLDILMPGMDGLEVCRKIRANPELADVQVIFVTGYSDIDPESIKRDTGAVDVLLKPVKAEELNAAVVKALSARAPHSL